MSESFSRLLLKTTKKRKKKMQILRNRAAIVLVLMLALAVSLVSVPIVAAQNWSIYISVGTDWLVRGKSDSIM